MTYTTCCIESDATSIGTMANAAREVTLRTLRRHCQGVDDWAESQGYERTSGRGGLTLATHTG